jgi:hypothetical protein
MKNAGYPLLARCSSLVLFFPISFFDSPYYIFDLFTPSPSF